MQARRAQPRLMERFEVRSELGRGGSGRVLCCFDHEVGHEVALKQLVRLTPEGIKDFKKEFRILLDIRHPNIVRLGELIELDQCWFISQELVEGADFNTYVTRDDTVIPADPARLMPALSQVLIALGTLHQAGVVHRDVKPDNVRVTDAGRVVLLDFGIATPPDEQEQPSTVVSAGTPAYMAPEQAYGKAVTPEADMYALGVMLFEALTGRLPFTGTAIEMLLGKCEKDAPRPSQFADGIAPELEALCLLLLARTPETRPTAVQALARLAHAGHGGDALPTRGSSPVKEVFVGRRSELSTLRESYDAACRGSARAVIIEGESGIGKSALLAEFLKLTGSDEQKPMVVRGRCHAAEQLRFKAFDAVVDVLAKKLVRRGETVQLAPEEIALLLVLFPAFALAVPKGRIPSAGRMPDRSAMFRAFARVLSQASRSEPLIIAIDDLQWSDADSLQLLQMLLTDERLSKVLFVFTLRPREDYDPRLTQALERLLGLAAVQRISLGCLSSEESAELCAASLPASAAHAVDARLIASTRGHPYLLTELVHHGDESVVQLPTLEDSLRKRVRSLSVLEQEVLETLAIANAPLSTRTLLRALAGDAELVTRAVVRLRADRFARVVRPGTLSLYHDKLRTVLIEGLAEDAIRARHLSLATAQELESGVDPAQLAFHFVAAGAGDRARPWLQRAFDLARERAAFAQAVDHASALLALETDARRLRALLSQRAELLGYLGRGLEAADGYLEAMEGAEPEAQAELCTRAAEQLLRIGEQKRGLVIAQRAFGLVGLGWSRNILGMLVRALISRISVLFSREQEKPPEVARLDAVRFDTLNGLGQPLAWMDWGRHVEILWRLTAIAQRTSQPRFMAISLCSHVIGQSMVQAPEHELRALLARAGKYAERDGSPDSRLMHELADGLFHYFRLGDLRAGSERFAAVNARYGNERLHDRWHLANARGLLLLSYFMIGKHREHAALSNDYVEDAHKRGDRVEATMCANAGLGVLRHLHRDQPDAALAELSSLRYVWDSRTVGAQHFAAWMAEHFVIAYARPEQAAEFWKALHQKYGRALILHLPVVHDLSRLLTGQALLARAVHADASDTRKALARHVERMGRPRTFDGQGYFPYVAAQRAVLEGAAPDATRALLARARVAFKHMSHHFLLHVELLESHLQGRDAFRAREAELLAWYREQGWQHPDRALRMVLPIYPRLVR